MRTIPETVARLVAAGGAIAWYGTLLVLGALPLLAVVWLALRAL